jgi:hypothetical protein
MKKKLLLLILCLSDISKDPRVIRQINWLESDYELIVAGYTRPLDHSVCFIDISPPGWFYRKIRSSLAKISILKYIYCHFRKIRYSLAKILILKLIYRSIFSSTISSTNVISDGLRGYSQNENVELEFNPNIYYENKIKNISCYDNLKQIEPNLILANDLDCLVIARQLWPNVKVVFDAHEFAPGEYNSTDNFWLKNEKPSRIWACNNYLSSVSGMTTVCQGIADEFNRNFNIPCNIEIITNSPFFESIPVKGTGSIIRVIHHGIGSPLRKIELMAEAVKELGKGWELHLILVEGDFAYIKSLKKRYKNYANIYFHDPVPTKLIAKFISQFDIGIFILEPDIFNYKWALPNKFFEFIQARLAIAVGPSPEMARIVNSYGLGIVSPDFSAESMASSLKSLSKIEIDIFKSNSNNAASIYSAERNRDKMLSVIKNALTNSIGSAS